jgi:hypothetical protein
MEAPSGYLTERVYSDFSLNCGGSYRTQSVAVGSCITYDEGSVQNSLIVNYDGNNAYKTVFDTADCIGIFCTLLQY